MRTEEVTISTTVGQKKELEGKQKIRRDDWLLKIMGWGGLFLGVEIEDFPTSVTITTGAQTGHTGTCASISFDLSPCHMAIFLEPTLCHDWSLYLDPWFGLTSSATPVVIASSASST